MKFCSACGQPVRHEIPPGDNRPRAVCVACGTIHYQNPRMVVGCIPEWGDRILLCRRAIEPRRGYWTMPAGFMENGETLQQAAARETYEEALARVEVHSMLAITHVLYAAQVHITFTGQLAEERFAPGTESLEVGLYAEADIPWDALAFPSVSFALRAYYEDRRTGRRQLHFSDVEQPLGRPAT